jgi:hypothetical protein
MDTTIPQQAVETAVKHQLVLSSIDVDDAMKTTSTGQAFVRLLAGRGLITVDLDQDDTYQSFVAKVRAKAGRNCLPPDGVFSFWTGKGRIEPSSWSVAACKGATLTVLMTLLGGGYEPELKLNKSSIIWPDVERLGLKVAFHTVYGDDVEFPKELTDTRVDFFLSTPEDGLSIPAKAFQAWLKKLDAAYDPVPPLHFLPWSDMKTRTFTQLRMSIEKWITSKEWTYNTAEMGRFSENPGGPSAVEQILGLPDDSYRSDEIKRFWKEVKEVVRIARASQQASYGEYMQYVFLFFFFVEKRRKKVFSLISLSVYALKNPPLELSLF